MIQTVLASLSTGFSADYTQWLASTFCPAIDIRQRLTLVPHPADNRADINILTSVLQIIRFDNLSRSSWIRAGQILILAHDSREALLGTQAPCCFRGVWIPGTPLATPLSGNHGDICTHKSLIIWVFLAVLEKSVSLPLRLVFYHTITTSGNLFHSMTLFCLLH